MAAVAALALAVLGNMTTNKSIIISSNVAKGGQGKYCRCLHCEQIPHAFLLQVLPV
jgi:hypothetical protein